MLLRTIDSSLGIIPRAIIGAIRVVSPNTPVDILRAFAYRPKELGKPFCALCHAVMRGKSEWSEGDRELLGAFVSNLNRCAHCSMSHCEVASIILGKSKVRAMLEENDGLDGHAKLRALLAFARKLTLEPKTVDSRDIEDLRNASVGEAAILDGVLIVTGFSFINRVASALHFEIASRKDVLPTAWFLRVFGYRFLVGLALPSAANLREIKPTDQIRAARRDRAILVGSTTKWLELLCASDPSGRHRGSNIGREVFRKVQQEPGSVTEEDVASLKSLGYSCDEIFDLILASAATAALVRLHIALRAMGCNTDA